MEERKKKKKQTKKKQREEREKVRSIFKYARPQPGNLCAATNISKSFPFVDPESFFPRVALLD